MKRPYDTSRLKIGDVYLMYFSGDNNEQTGWRPGLIFQNNTGNIFSPNVIAIPFTSSIKKENQPTHVVIPASESGFRKDSMALCENPERMSKSKIKTYITTIPDVYMEKIAIASILASSAISFIDPDALHDVWEKANVLNNQQRGRYHV